MPLNIDFKEIFLHLFNFFLLLLILYKLMYKPVKKFMEDRQNYYKELEENANAKILDAEDVISKGKIKLEEINKDADNIKAEAIKKAEEIANEKILEAKKESEAILVKARAQAESEQKRILEETNSKIRELAVATTKKILLENTDDVYDDFFEKVDA